MSKSYPSAAACGAIVTMAALFQGCFTTSADVAGAQSADSPGDGDGDSDGYDDEDGVGVGGQSSAEDDPNAGEPMQDEEFEDERRPVGQGGAYESEASAPPPCVSLLSLGEVATEGAVPGERGTDAVVSWLNENSNAQASYIQEQHELSEVLLEGTDVVLLQDISRWEFTQEELSTFQNWVEEGGGVMALSGYASALTHTFPANELLSFSGLNHSMTFTAQSVAAQCGYCLGTTYKQGGWNSMHPIAEGISYVGAFSGRAIHGNGDIVASEAGVNFAVAKEVGEGRVFFFHDDWVTYATHWAGEGLNRCTGDMTCSDVSIEKVYQVPRFWYNSIRWLAGEPSCFEIEGL